MFKLIGPALVKLDTSKDIIDVDRCCPHGKTFEPNEDGCSRIICNINQ